MQDVPLTINYKGRKLTGFAVPLMSFPMETPRAFDIIIEKAFLGTLRWNAEEWKIDTDQDPLLIEKIGTYIRAWYE